MNGNVDFQKKFSKGYYDIFNYSVIGGRDVVGDLFRWDGKKYVKVPEKEMQKRGKVK